MRNLRLELAYDGTSYAGWQRQKQENTIQGLVEKALSTMTRAEVTLHGAGRTDAGVHALRMVANFQTASRIPTAGFLKGLNSILPDDIRIFAAQEVSADFHARYSATGKAYLYIFFVGEIMPPTARLYAAHLTGAMDLAAMRACLRQIEGSHDFSSFEAAGSRDPSSREGMGAVRHIHAVQISEAAGRPGFFEIAIAGNGFLRHMVRNIVGTLFEAGRGRISVDGFGRILAAKDRSQAGPTASACGLFLKDVFYPDGI